MGRKGTFIIGRDLTERRRAEKERRDPRRLSRTNENLEVTLKSIADGVISVDQNDGVVLMNRAAEDLIGVNRRYGVGKNIRSWCPFQIGSGTITGPCVRPGPFRVAMHNSGQTWQMECSYITLTSDKARSWEDVRLQRHLREGPAEIAEANAGRLEAIGTLAGGIAHDFNNVMTSVVGDSTYCAPRSRTARARCSGPGAHLRYGNGHGPRQVRGPGAAVPVKGGAPIQKPTTLRGLLEDTAEAGLHRLQHHLVSGLPG